MKILWFTNTPSLYDAGKHQYHGGGWIESLEQLITRRADIELAIAFFHPFDKTKMVRGSTTYYPIHRPAGKRRPLHHLISNWRGHLTDINYNNQFLKVIKDFKPDAIQVFGSEGPFGDIQALTETPVVIHLQGLINPYLNTYFPPGYSGQEFITNPAYFMKTIKGSSPLHTRRLFVKQAERERRILENTRYVMGRTHWDAMIARLYNPSVVYFHVDEVLRPIFYEQPEKLRSFKAKFEIVSTLSPTIYKGIDVVLRTAKQLQQLTDIDFTWKVAGINSNDPLLQHFEKKEGIQHRSVGIECVGKQASPELVQLLSNADVFVHPSYIDNSPNSVCEAQMLGLTVVACDVGGMSTLIRHQQTGILVPSNGVFELVHHLCQLAANKHERTSLGENARKAALQRHNKETIIQHLITTYNDIVSIV